MKKNTIGLAIVKMLPDAKRDGKIRLFKSCEPDKFGDGEQCRDFIYVKDVAKMTCEFLKQTDASGIFNIGRGVPSTWKQLAQGVIAGMGADDVHIEFIDMPEALLGKYQNYTCADTSKFVQCLGEEAAKTMPLKEAVVEYVSGYLQEEKRW